MPVLVPAAGQQLAVNGVDLSQYAVVTESLGPLMATPPRRGKNVAVPGRHGTIHTPRKRFDETDIGLRCYVLGAQPDGTVPVGSTAAKELYARADALMTLFTADTVSLTRTMPDGSTRTATAEVLGAMNWARRLGDAPLIAMVTVSLTLPAAFWFDTAAVSQTITGVTGTVATMTAFTGATAPMTDLTITCTGPVSNPKLTQGTRYVQWNGVVSSGQQLVISTANWQVGPGSGSAWNPDLRNVSFGPGPEWFMLDPTTALQVTLTHTGGGSASVTIAGKRAYLSA